VTPKVNLNNRNNINKEPVETLESLPEGFKLILSYKEVKSEKYHYYVRGEEVYRYNPSRNGEMYQLVNWSDKRNQIILRNNKKGDVTIPKSKWSLIVTDCACEIIFQTQMSDDDWTPTDLQTHEFIYRVQPEQFIGTDVYKFGRTINPQHRFVEYGDCTVIRIFEVSNQYRAEHELMVLAKLLFGHPVQGREYFEVPELDDAIQIIKELALDFLV
jgi:hypothetical protein